MASCQRSGAECDERNLTARACFTASVLPMRRASRHGCSSWVNDLPQLQMPSRRREGIVADVAAGDERDRSAEGAREAPLGRWTTRQETYARASWATLAKIHVLAIDAGAGSPT